MPSDIACRLRTAATLMRGLANEFSDGDWCGVAEDLEGQALSEISGKEWLTSGEAAWWLGCNRQTVHEAAKRGAIESRYEARDEGARMTLVVERESLERWNERRRRR